MKILFLGTGSIGQRHIRLLQAHFDHELYALRPGPVKDLPGVTQLADWLQVENIRPDAAFVCNPTNMHISSAIECAARGMAIFIEKPLDVDIFWLEVLRHYCRRYNINPYVAYPMRFHPNIQAIKLFGVPPSVSIERDVEIVCRTNLNTWRKYETYSAHRDQGGGCLLELSHEIDYARFLFGRIEHISGDIGKDKAFTGTDAETWAHLRLYHETGVVSWVKLDIASGTEERFIRLGEHLFPARSTDAEYLKQLHYFFNNMNRPDIMNGLYEAAGLCKQMLAFREEAWTRL